MHFSASSVLEKQKRIFCRFLTAIFCVIPLEINKITITVCLEITAFQVGKQRHSSLHTVIKLLLNMYLSKQLKISQEVAKFKTKFFSGFEKSKHFETYLSSSSHNLKNFKHQNIDFKAISNICTTKIYTLKKNKDWSYCFNICNTLAMNWYFLIRYLVNQFIKVLLD